MKTIYECLKKQPNDQFQICKQVNDRDIILWLAPESGTHDVEHIAKQHSVGTIHFVIIPNSTELHGLLWTTTVGSMQEPNSIGVIGYNVIVHEPYNYGVFYSL